MEREMDKNKWNDALTEIDEKAEKIKKVSDSVWNFAETAFKETESVKVICDALETEGFSVKKDLAGIKTAFSGTWGKGKPVIGILGEFDALSGLNQASMSIKKESVDSSSKGLPGHGCGHNLLGSASLGAVMGIKAYLEQSGKSGTVVYFGCPGEEGGSGKTFMARDGVFDDVDMALTWHPEQFNKVCTDSTLANFQIKYRFRGVSAHAAGCPHLGRSALDALELMNTGINFLREHMLPEDRVHYSITDAGGYSPNVVQPFAEGIYLMRGPTIADAEDLFKRVDKIAQGAALMTETSMEKEFMKACANVMPNNVLQNEFYSVMKEIPIPQPDESEVEYAAKITASVENPEDAIAKSLRKYSFADQNEMRKNLEKYPSVRAFLMPLKQSEEIEWGSTDVGDVSWVCPTAQIRCATWAACTPGHSWQVVSQGKSSYAQKAVIYAAKVLAATAINCFENTDIVKQAKDELALRKEGKGYSCPIPKDVEAKPLV